MRRGRERSFRGHAETIRQPAYHPHVRTQQGRVNAQQGRCPLNLKGFLATTLASKSSDFDDRIAIRRVPNDSKIPRDRYASKMRRGDRSADLRTASHDEKKMAGYTRTSLFIRHGHRDSTSTRGFPALPESYACTGESWIEGPPSLVVPPLLLVAAIPWMHRCADFLQVTLVTDYHIVDHFALASLDTALPTTSIDIKHSVFRVRRMQQI
ncbi:hypothetical protein EAG_02042 [Camponotus floridanus]|uniref:Uncharacterized protein n=1 Tax=Camponotus floridanus TaxID=104421 RepID=E2A0B3_CAMFO|nr:hypothetical protein EAG_02042 [Camponotus floridanus]